MADYIVQKPTDRANMSARAAKAIPDHLHITPKYDGCCAVMMFTDAGYHASFSAVGNLAPSLDHVGKFIEDTCGVAAFRGMCIVGEAWREKTEFKDISGMFRRQRVQPELRFAPFDVVRYTPGDNFPLLDDPSPFVIRILRLGNIRTWDSNFLVNVPQYQGGKELADKLAKEYKARGGYDGAIARDWDAPYTVKRTTDAIKFKPVVSLDLRCVAVYEAEGEKTGRTVLTLGVEYNGSVSVVGSGVPHDLRPEDALHKIVEVECMGVTPAGKLREPRFKGIRYDKTGPDA